MVDLATSLKRRLQTGGTVIGSWLSLGSVSVAEVMARAGFDFLVVDMEHSAIGVREAADMIRVIELSGCSPLVRLPGFDPALTKVLLDAGAHGIVVPNVASASVALDSVRATRYPPAGVRGVGLNRAQGYGPDFRDYLASAGDGLIVVVQIESAAGVAQIAEITAVEGIDAVMVGPYDLSADLGSPGDFEGPEFKDAVGRVLEAARAAQVATGIHLVEPDPAGLRDALNQGHRFMVYSVDMRILDVGARLGVVTAGTTE